MHAIVLGLIGALLGAVIGRCRLGPLLRYLALAVVGMAGLAGVLIVNSIVAERYLPELYGNPSLGAGVFLLGLCYLERRFRRMPNEAATHNDPIATHMRSAEGR
jgi:hypothetical protein